MSEKIDDEFTLPNPDKCRVEKLNFSPQLSAVYIENRNMPPLKSCYLVTRRIRDIQDIQNAVMLIRAAQRLLIRASPYDSAEIKGTTHTKLLDEVIGSIREHKLRGHWENYTADGELMTEWQRLVEKHKRLNDD